MEMASFNHQQIMINPFDSTVDEEFFDPKRSFSEIFSPFSPCNSSSFPVETHHASSNGQILLKQLNNGADWSSHAAAELSHHQKVSSAFSSGPQLISFGKSSNSSILPDSDKLLDDMCCNKIKSITRTPLQAQYHVEAERKRREKLSELFISLSKIVPGLKKLDKASLLGDAIKYMKELEERVKILEEEAKRNSTEFDAMETRSDISTYDKDLSFIKNSNGTMRDPIPDVSVRVSNKNLLIKIHCQKHNGFLRRIPIEMETLRLSIQDIRVIPFGCSTLDITILAEMDRGFSPAVRDIIKHLQMAILSPNETLNKSFSEDCFHHLSPLSGSEAWQA